MKVRTSVTLLLAVTALAVTLLNGCATPVPEPTTAPIQVNLESSGKRSASEWNVAGKAHVGASGYDPVSYFAGADAVPLPGDPAISVRYGGVVYLFANEANRARFAATPERFEPAHGGWCAYAMAQGSKYAVDPTSYLIQDGRLLLFYRDTFTDTRANWLADDAEQQLADADREWFELTGERAK